MQMMRAMRGLVLGVGVLLLGAVGASAQDWAKMAQADWARAELDRSPRHREYVPVRTAAGRVVSTFVVYPETSGKASVVVLVHEIFGLSDWAKLMADELAAKGYIVLLPDLLSGTSPGGAKGTGGTDAYPSVDAVVKAVSGLPEAQVMGDLDAVADYAAKIPAGTGKVSVAGFCWGGGETFSFATHRPGLVGSYVFYGPTPEAGLERISAPVYGFYAGNDARITATVPETTERMKAAGKMFAPVTYAGAGHGFMRAGQAPDAAEANRKAWQEGFARLLEELGKRR